MQIVLDAIDRRILRELQADATVPIAELAERAGLSQTPCWKRVKRLTAAGVIERRVALLDRERLDLGLAVSVQIRTSRHDQEAIAAVQPDLPAFIQGERTVSWGEFDARADALAAHLLAKGLDHQAKVAAFLYNGPEYIEAYAAAFKAGFAPVNTNYRYGPEELF